MDINTLKLLQGLPLNLKIRKTELRLNEAIDRFGAEGLYISMSGGKDSTVVHTISAKIEMERFGELKIKRVFVDTGLEYPEIKEFIYDLKKKYGDLIEIIRPKVGFKEVIEKYGYPVVSKEQSRYIWDIRNGTDHMKQMRLNKNTQFSLSKKWYYLLDAPFKISSKCCDVMKKNPFKSYEHKTGRIPIIGVMADESRLRMQVYINSGGCNSFEAERPQSRPIGFWTEQDILEYIYKNKIEISKIYKKVKLNKDGTYSTTGVNRSGCIFCLYGISQEQAKGKNRLEKLKKSHPNIYKYCMQNLKIKEVCDFMDIRY